MQKWMVGIGSVATMGLTALSAHAAADPLIVNAAGDFATSAKENIVGTITSSTVLTALTVVFGIVVALIVVPRIFKRMAK